MTDRPEKELHVAPMLKVSYPEFRYFCRLLSRRAVLWTEMIMAERLLREPERYLDDADAAPPVVCQIGGHDPVTAAQAVRLLVKTYNNNNIHCFREVNLNAECPSNHVCTKHEMGAALMKRVDVAVQVLRAMQHEVALADDDNHHVDISIKMRITINDESDLPQDFLIPLIQTLRSEAGCRRFYLHARRVYTAGLLSCKKNRLVPPLNYPAVYRACECFPDCDFWINGGIMTVKQAKDICWGIPTQLAAQQHAALPCQTCQAPHGSCIAPPCYPAPVNLRGCMMGRAVMEQPACLARVDTDFYGAASNPSRNRRQVLQGYCDYLQQRHPPTCQSTTEALSCNEASSSIQTKVRCPNCGYDGTTTSSTTTACSTTTPLPSKQQQQQQREQTPKSAKHLGRMLKPTMGLFHGVKKGGRSWSRILQALGKDPQFIQCGPALVLRMAMARMPGELLDFEF